MRLFMAVLLCALAFGQVSAHEDQTAVHDNNGAPPEESQKPASGVLPQVYPAVQLAALFPAAVQISFAVAVVPDPLVPRYRRPYDLEIAALELGMLEDGYVLDRFYLPWNDELRTDEQHKDEQHTDSSDHAAQIQSLLQQAPMKFRYGLMIFRCDGWRLRDELNPGKAAGQTSTGSPCNAPINDPSTSGARIRALYIVTDTATKGIENGALLCAVERIDSQLPAGKVPGGTRKDPKAARKFPHCWQWRPVATEARARGTPVAAEPPLPQAALLSYPGACQAFPSSSTLLVLGPNFSGSVDSAGEAARRLELAFGKDLPAQPIKSMCLLSSSASDTTNSAANELWSNAPFAVRYESLAPDNTHKLRDIAHLLPAVLGKSAPAEASSPSPVAILAEGSTFGYGVCGYADDRDHAMPPEVRDLCLTARRLYFPANIADVRYGLQQVQQHQARDNPLKLELPTGHLSLDLGAENGSEYPESRQSALTSVGIQLALEQVLDQLQAHPPKVVIVVATDVRDRLFLFDELRKRLARAMLIDLESDNLISHPDFLHASRGALAIGSAELTTQWAPNGCNATGAGSHTMSTWSADFQAILADAVSHVYVPATERAKPPCEAANEASQVQYRRPVLQVVSLEGLRNLTKKASAEVATDTQAQADGAPAPNRAMLASAEISAPFFCLGAAWLLISPLLLPHFRPTTARRPGFSLTDSVVTGILLTYPIAAFLVARSLHAHDHDNLACLGTFLILCAGLAGLVTCVRQLRQTTSMAPRTNLRNVVGPALLALAATGFATLPSIWYASIQSSLTDPLLNLDISELETLALDPDPGLAFLLLVALATLTLLYSCVVLATSAGIVNRNSALLRGLQATTTNAPAIPPERAEPVPPPCIIPTPSMGVLNGGVGTLFVSSVEPLELPRALRLNPSSPQDPSMMQGRPESKAKRGQRELRGALNLNPLGLSLLGVLLIFFIVVPDLLWGDVRLTVFGPLASRIALLALAATSLCATVLLACSLGMSRRISALSRYLTTARKQSSPENCSGRWPIDVAAPRVFPATPVLARAADGGRHAKTLVWGDNLDKWQSLISGWLHLGEHDSAHQVAIFALLATELSVFRWCVLGTALCALGSIGTAYLFPIEADPLLIFNLLLLIGSGALAGLSATTFERDALLSNVLCNRPAPRKFSTSLFAFIAVPFIALAVACAIAQVPGVVDWGGGLLQLMGALGQH